VILVAVCAAASRGAEAQEPAGGRTLYRSEAFTLTDTSVRQGRFEAVAVTRDRIESTYPRAAREVMFKFSINGQDNEFPPGQDHMIYVRPRGGRIVTPVYTFGRLDDPLMPTPEAAPVPGEEGTAAVTIRLDMRHVLASFRATGAYDPPNGPPVSAKAFQGVYVAGNAEPLSWDFSRLRPGSRFQLTDPDGDGIYTVTLPFDAQYTRPALPNGRTAWERRRDLSRFPELTSSQRLVDAIHRLSLEELLDLRREDGALVAGAKWPGVWTRDVSWGALLGFALVAPDEVRASLVAKVDSSGRIIQDTGTGGSWPVSTDRVAWTLAAWELYCVTGDGAWLRTAYDVARRSAESDLLSARDPETGLFRGESSFLDWREQSYPRWMDPRDIYLSLSLGTNALHYASYTMLARMARALGDTSPEAAPRYERVAAQLRDAMNAYLWQSDRGYYGQFRYGRVHQSLSPRAEGLGEALSVIYDVPTDAQRAVLARRMPVVPFGVPSFWPYIPGVPPYHNAGIWPQVVGFWAWAAAESGNEAAVEHALASTFRATALFLTNKENMVASTGHFEGTELNSDRLIGSVGAGLGAVYRVLFGARLGPDRLVFEPFVPRAYDGERTLRGLRYRGAVLTVTVRGFGDSVARVALDGRPVARAEVPADLIGAHTLEITMNGSLAPSAITIAENIDSPETPRVTLAGNRLTWRAVPGAVSYRVYRDGRQVAVSARAQATVARANGLVEYQVLAVDARGIESFLSEPVRVAPRDAVVVAEPVADGLETRVAGYEGAGYVAVSATTATTVRIPVTVPRTGTYTIDVRYANGSGPVNSADMAAIRTLGVDGRRAGTVVMPQRGTDLWTDWGWSSPVRVALEAGARVLTLTYEQSDVNMNRHVNVALIDHVRITRLADPE
jgi:hypothetical protein